MVGLHNVLDFVRFRKLVLVLVAIKNQARFSGEGFYILLVYDIQIPARFSQDSCLRYIDSRTFFPIQQEAIVLRESLSWE